MGGVGHSSVRIICMADPRQNIVAVASLQSSNNRGGAVGNSFDSAETPTPLPDAALHPGTTPGELKAPTNARRSNHAPPPLCESSPRNGVFAHKSLTLLHAPHLGNSGPYCDRVRDICASQRKNEQQGIVNAPAIICCGNFDHATDPLCTVCEAYDGIRRARCSVAWHLANGASDDTLGALTVGGPVGPAPAATTRW